MIKEKSNGEIEVLMIDFGLCSKIIRDGDHIEQRENEGIRGTLIYMSRNAMEGRTQSRKDDWESLIYVIYSLINGSLPWHYEQDRDKMLKMKNDFVAKQQWEGLPDIFKKYSEAIYALSFKQVPDVTQLISFLMQIDFSYYEINWNNFIED